MKVKVESLGLPTLSAIIGKKVEIETPPGNISDLIQLLVKRHGHKVRQILLDAQGELDLTIQVMLNDDGFVTREKFAVTPLNDGDLVRLMLLAGGG